MTGVSTICPGEVLVPRLCSEFGVRVEAHHIDSARSRKDSRVREPSKKCRRPEPVIAVTMGNEDVFQSLATFKDPRCDPFRLFDRHRRINENRVRFAEDQG